MDFELKGEFIALCDLLKTTGIANGGGQGKLGEPISSPCFFGILEER